MANPWPRRFGVLLSLAAAWGVWAGAAAAEPESVVIGEDGSVAGRFACGEVEKQAMVFRLGLPQEPAIKMWREQAVLRSLRVANGIHYTQTALVSRPSRVTAEAVGDIGAVLLVNLEGNNTNREYAEAFAEVSLEVGGKRQELELKDGFLWRLNGPVRVLLGALEIPDSGIKASRGQALRFSGNMPPSLKGSMTLKLPLEAIRNPAAAETLRDLDFEQELRQALKPQPGTTQSEPYRLIFAQDKAP